MPELFRPFLKHFSVILEITSSQQLDGSTRSGRRPWGKHSFPDELLNKVDTVFREIHIKVESVAVSRKSIRPLRDLPVPIRLYNPRFEEDFEIGRDYDPDRERALARKLRRQVSKPVSLLCRDLYLHFTDHLVQVTKERRGARRELRKDNIFLTDERNREKSALVEERNADLRKGLIFLEQQEADWKSGAGGGGLVKKRMRLRDAKSLLPKKQKS